MTSIRHIDGSATVDQRYLDAAHDAVLAVGWSRATLTDIARRAGVSRMTLYRRWPDTRALLADLMTREWQRVVAEVLADVRTDPAPTPSVLARAVADTVAALRTDPLLRRVVDVDPEVLLPYLLDRRGRTQDLLGAQLAEAVAAGQRAGRVREGDPEVMARALLLACHGFLLSAHTMTASGRRGADVSGYDDELRRLVEGHLS